MKRLIFILLFVSSVLQAQTNYYVSNTGGGDTLATMAEVAALNLTGDDSVLFKRGDRWIITEANFSDGFYVNSHSGTSGHPINYGAYGTGAKPIITGRQSITDWNVSGNWTETSAGSHIWYMATDITANLYQYSNRGRLWLNGTEAMKANSTTTPTALLPWCNNNQTVYLYATSNPATYFTNIESIGVCPSVMICTQDYISFSNLDFQGGGNQIQILGDNITFDHCNIGMYAGECGIRAVYPGGVINHLKVSYCTFDTGDTNFDGWMLNNSEDGVLISQGGDDMIFEYNVWKNWGHFGLNLYTTTSDPITNVKVYGNQISAPDIDFGHAFGFGNSYATYGLCTGNEIYNNYFYNHPSENEFNGDGFKFYNNIIDGVFGVLYDGGRGYLTWGSEGIAFGNFLGYCRNIEIHNNIIMNTRDGGLWFAYAGGGTYEGNSIKNNIIYNCGYGQTGHAAIDLEWSPGVMLTNTFDNNLIYTPGYTDIIMNGKMRTDYYQTVAEFNAMNGITTGMWTAADAPYYIDEVYDNIHNNIQSNPLFVDPDNANYLLRDYSLSEGSPAIGAGIDVGLTTDYAGNAWATTPSIGALEYDATPPTPEPEYGVSFLKGSDGKFMKDINGNILKR